MSKFHNDWIKIQGEIASYKNVPRIIRLKSRCKINIFGHSPNIILSSKFGLIFSTRSLCFRHLNLQSGIQSAGGRSVR